MKRLIPSLFLSALILALVVWYFSPGPSLYVPDLQSVPAPADPAATQRKIGISNLQVPSVAASAYERSTLADPLNTPVSNIRADLRVVSDLLATFRTNFPGEGNPVGTNAEITAVLTGKNKLNLALIPPGHPAINKEGELCDRWGTPFFFHAESGSRMTIESAGPDKKRHTADDESFAP